MGWTQSDFDFSEPRYFFNAVEGQIRADYERARLIGWYASMIHSSKPLKLNSFGRFPWESEEAYKPIFGEVDKEAFDRINAFQFPN